MPTLKPSYSPGRLYTCGQSIGVVRYPGRNANLSRRFSGFYAEKLDEVSLETPRLSASAWMFNRPKRSTVIGRLASQKMKAL